ncbi:MAG: hypothetical protein JOY96_00915 [Verrucomicrobia bacterium]|nr:hypothetical protein [Verrucomicrobiota bacterium]
MASKETVLERATLRSISIDSEVVALAVIKRGEERFAFEIFRDDRLAASGEEQKTAERAAKSGLSVWRRIAKTVLAEKLGG